MTRSRVTAATAYANSLGYSRLVSENGHAWIAGCAPVTATGEFIGKGDVYAQAEQCIAMLADALNAVGFTLADIVRTRIYLRSFDDAEEMMRAHRDAFGDIRPACTVVAVADLVLPDMRVYLDADAYRCPD